MLANCATSACYVLYMRLSIRKVEFADFDSVYFNNMLAMPIMIVASVFFDDWRDFASH